MLSKHDVVQWKNDKVTKVAFDWLREQREQLKEHVITGGATAESVDGTAQLVAKSIGKAEMAQEMLDYFLEDLLESAHEDAGE